MRCTACDWAACRLVCRMSGRVPVQPLAHLRVRTFESPTKSTFDVCNTQHLVLSSRILRVLFQQFVHLRVRTLHPQCLRKSPSKQESIHFLTCSLNSNSHQGTRLSTSVGLLLVHKGHRHPSLRKSNADRVLLGGRIPSISGQVIMHKRKQLLEHKEAFKPIYI